MMPGDIFFKTQLFAARLHFLLRNYIDLIGELHLLIETIEKNPLHINENRPQGGEVWC
jgi:hypothetical protein